MNKFDEKYDIRLAHLDDIPMIMKFIDEHWKKGHILAIDRILFEYEFVYKNQVNFILAIEKQKKSIEGIFGFLNASYPDNKEKKDIWGSFWKVKQGNMPFLGIEIAKRVYNLTQCRMELGCGLNVNTAVPLRKKVFKDRVEKMDHYYMLNESINKFVIANIEKRPKNNFIKDKQVDCKKLNSSNLLQSVSDETFEKNLPFKDAWYVEKKYFNHPYYEYNVYELKKINEIYGALLVTREVTYKERKALRIVDYIGNRKLIQHMGRFFNDIMRENRYEYIDLYTFGFEKDYLFNAGFSLKNEQDRNIIPNYFEPFEQKNIELWVNYPSEYDKVIFFKADADQDRPNLLKKNQIKRYNKKD